jgi:hypothetical protein
MRVACNHREGFREAARICPGTTDEGTELIERSATSSSVAALPAGFPIEMVAVPWAGSTVFGCTAWLGATNTQRSGRALPAARLSRRSRRQAARRSR